MPLITSSRRVVPVARRQLAAQPAKLVASVLAVAAAVALVLLLAGLRRGVAEQATLYLDRQPPVVVGQVGMRDFLSQASVLSERVGGTLERVRGVAEVEPVSQQFAMLRLHDKHVLTLLIGYDPGRGGGPWALTRGREPRGRNELVLDRVLADEHGLEVGSLLAYRGAVLRVVGLSRGTSGFMTPLAFATRATVNGLGGQAGTAGFFFVQPRAGITAAAIAERIRATVPGVAVATRETIAAKDRQLFAAAFSGPLLAMVLIALAAAALVVGLTVYGSTVERSREYATLKALGLRLRGLATLAGIQAGAIAAGGAGLGVALAVGGRAIAAQLAPQYLIAFSTGLALAVVAAALVVALLAAAFPVRYLVRLDPAAAFRR